MWIWTWVSQYLFQHSNLNVCPWSVWFQAQICPIADPSLWLQDQLKGVYWNYLPTKPNQKQEANQFHWPRNQLVKEEAPALLPPQTSPYLRDQTDSGSKADIPPTQDTITTSTTTTTKETLLRSPSSGTLTGIPWLVPHLVISFSIISSLRAQVGQPLWVHGSNLIPSSDPAFPFCAWSLSQHPSNSDDEERTSPPEIGLEFPLDLSPDETVGDTSGSNAKENLQFYTEQMLHMARTWECQIQNPKCKDLVLL